MSFKTLIKELFTSNNREVEENIKSKSKYIGPNHHEITDEDRLKGQVTREINKQLKNMKLNNELEKLNLLQELEMTRLKNKINAEKLKGEEFEEEQEAPNLEELLFSNVLGAINKNNFNQTKEVKKNDFIVVDSPINTNTNTNTISEEDEAKLKEVIPKFLTQKQIEVLKQMDENAVKDIHNIIRKDF